LKFLKRMHTRFLIQSSRPLFTLLDKVKTLSYIQG